jgi:hypothetical protein
MERVQKRGFIKYFYVAFNISSDYIKFIFIKYEKLAMERNSGMKEVGWNNKEETGTQVMRRVVISPE